VFGKSTRLFLICGQFTPYQKGKVNVHCRHFRMTRGQRPTWPGLGWNDQGGGFAAAKFFHAPAASGAPYRPEDEAPGRPMPAVLRAHVPVASKGGLAAAPETRRQKGNSGSGRQRPARPSVAPDAVFFAETADLAEIDERAAASADAPEFIRQLVA
jgi:hypothetical protein